MDDWRLDEEDEPEASWEEVFGPERPKDRMTAAMDRVKDLVLHKESEGLDAELVAALERKLEALNDAAEAERFADYLEAA